MITWGMVGNSHDASLAVFYRKKLLWASLSKDFSCIPNDPYHNTVQIELAKRQFGYPDKIIWYEYPFLKTIRQFYAGQGWLLKENNIKQYLEKYNLHSKIFYTKHHHSHAAYAYYTQKHDDCAIICLDSIGEFETLTIWHGKNNNLKKIYSQGYPHSLGLFYSAMTLRLGLVPQRDEYMLAQLGSKGDPNKLFMDIFNDFICTKGMGFTPKIKLLYNLHKGCNWWRPDLTSQQDLYDIAAATQAVFEYCVLNLSKWVKKETRSNNLALAGGGALNKQAVDKIKVDWNNIWVPVNPGDPGSCIGSVLAKHKEKIDITDKWFAPN